MYQYHPGTVGGSFDLYQIWSLRSGQPAQSASLGVICGERGREFHAACASSLAFVRGPCIPQTLYMMEYFQPKDGSKHLAG